jgi:hypothetical protein
MSAGPLEVGVLLGIGVAMGATNASLTQLMAMRHLRGPQPDHKRFLRVAAVRLVVVAVVSTVFAVLFWPEGVAVFAGFVGLQLGSLAVKAVRRRRGRDAATAT